MNEDDEIMIDLGHKAAAEDRLRRVRLEMCDLWDAASHQKGKKQRVMGASYPKGSVYRRVDDIWKHLSHLWNKKLVDSITLLF